MTQKYMPIDINATGRDAVTTAFANQVAYCQNSGAPVTARICAALGACIAGDMPSRFLQAMRDWAGAPLADALPLRAAGGLHALHLAGAEARLAPIYADAPGVADAAIVAAVIADHDDILMPWLDGPPQTNEAGRSANFIAAMLWLADQGLPPLFSCLEIGSSAGINLMLARYHYNLGGVQVGPEPGAIAFAPEWQGPPPPDHAIRIIDTIGCDVAPVDLTDPAQAMRLKAYVWPEHKVRFARIDAAIAAATQQPPQIVEMAAADFVEQQLAKPQAAGVSRILLHSIVWQYVGAAEQARITAAMEAAGAAASADRPLAWVAVEANRDTHVHELVVRHWPNAAGDAAGAPATLATAHPHGAVVSWLG
ncbi:MAG: DUF2332 domain-containing protein [Sphingomonadaceae bacterium]|nr:DUF2332 domain-containing protein [Sphingomonadaceae bacterium]